MSQPSLADLARENARAIGTVFIGAIGFVAIAYLVAAEVLFVSRLVSPLALFHALSLSKGAIALHLAIIMGVLALTPFGLLFGMSSRIAKTRTHASTVVRQVCRILARRINDNPESSTVFRRVKLYVPPWLLPLHALQRALVQVPCAPPLTSGLLSRARQRVHFPFASGGLIA